MKILQARLFMSCMVIASLMIWAGFSDPDTIETLWPWLWAPAILLAAALTGLFAIFLKSRQLYMWSGLVVPLICIMRVAAIFNNHAEGVYPTNRRFLIALGYTLMIGVLWATVWVFVIGPVHTWKRQKV